MKERSVEELVDFVLNQVTLVQSQDFDQIKADVVAAAALECQLKLADVLSSAEFEMKQRENDLEFSEGEKATNIRTSYREKDLKLTEAQVKEHITSDTQIKESKKSLAEAQRDYKKWQYIYNTLKDAHIFFRNLNKSQ
jgi:hypothetical protein